MIFDANRRILLVDDNHAIHSDFRKVLLDSQTQNEALDDAEAMLFDEAPRQKHKPAKFSVDSAFQGQEALEMVIAAIAKGEPYAMAFVDVRMPPGWDGIETVSRIWEVDPSIQVVICTAYSDYSWETMTEKLGMSENLILLKKPFDSVEVLQIAHSMTRKWLVTRQASLRLTELEEMVEQRTAELEAASEEAALSEERFSKAFRNSPIPQAIQSLPAQRFVDVNDAFLTMTGFTREEVSGRTPLELGLCLDYETRFLKSVAEGKVVRNVETQIVGRDKELHTALVSLEPLTVAGQPHILMMAQDISDRLQLEHQLRQVQKMEAVGQLAAGIAHDFNNLLTIIQGHASLHRSVSGMPREVTNSLAQISTAAECAADLTRKLLTFSRKNMVRPKVIKLNEVIKKLGGMLHRLLGERVDLVTKFTPQLDPIFADATNIEQVLMNLTLNGRDAMPDGGTITVATSNVTIGEDSALHNPDARPGSYVCLCVTDTGTGMDEATRNRIFEPFFTTKELNKGTGMGLATVYGIVKQHGGWIEVDTEMGKGSTFRVLIPSTTRTAASHSESHPESVAAEGDHTIFVVEDDAVVRSLVVEVLTSYNYKVIEAENGDEAIERWPQCKEEVDLLLTDMVMPGEANGLAVARHCKSSKPNLKVIYTSGYSSELFGSDVQLEDGVNYLPKPYFCGKLTAIIRKALVPCSEEEPVGAAT